MKFRWSVPLLVFLMLIILVLPVMAQASGPDPVVTFTATPEVIAAAAGIALSLIFSYFPGLRTWYAARSEDQKKGIMLLALVGMSGAIYGLNCTGFIRAGIACDQNGAARFVWLLILALLVNQSAYKLSFTAKDVKAVKARVPAGPINPEAQG